MMSVLVGLTACEDDEEEVSSKSRRSNRVIKQVNEEGENTNSLSNFPVSNIKIYDINDAKEQILYSKDGNVYFSDFEGNTIFTVSAEGGNIGRFNNYIRVGDTIYQLDGTVLYTNINSTFVTISENGFVLLKLETDSMATGTVVDYNIVDPKNRKVIFSGKRDKIDVSTEEGLKEISEVNVTYVKEDLFKVETLRKNGGTDTDFINAADGTIASNVRTDEARDIERTIADYYPCLSEKRELYFDGTYDNVIYDKDKNVVKDLSEGEVKYYGYAGDKMYVYTRTDYYYVLDENFDYYVNPVKDTSMEQLFKRISDVTFRNIVSNGGATIVTGKGVYYLTGVSGYRYCFNYGL